MKVKVSAYHVLARRRLCSQGSAIVFRFVDFETVTLNGTKFNSRRLLYQVCTKDGSDPKRNIFDQTQCFKESDCLIVCRMTITDLDITKHPTLVRLAI